jgi:hypothetical protein
MGYRDVDHEQRPTTRGVRDCLHCHVRVMFGADGVCPSCRRSAHDPVVDDGMRRLTIPDRALLPDLCAGCGCATGRRQSTEGSRVTHGERTWLRALVFVLWSPIVALFIPGPSRRAVQVSLPVCPDCAKNGEFWPEHVDFEEGVLTLLVHRNLAEAFARSG